MGKKANASPLSLDGDWTISGVAEQFPRLSQQIALILDPPKAKKKRACASVSRLEIDLGGISALDACGCQLLTHFYHALHQHGIVPLFAHLPAPFLDTIHQLGFDQELANCFSSGRNQA